MKAFLATLAQAITSKVGIMATIVTVTATSIGVTWWATSRTIYREIATLAEDTNIPVEIIENPAGAGYCIQFDDEVVTKVRDRLKELSINPRTLYLSGDYEYLNKFVKAEIATNYPNLGGVITDEDGNATGHTPLNPWSPELTAFQREWSQIEAFKNITYMQGIINVIRRDVEWDEENPDDQGYYLEYIPYGDKDTEGTFAYLLEQNDEEAFEKLKKCFSINEENWDICVATYTKVYGDVENTFKIAEQKVSYKNQVAKYSMPFEFLIALLLTTNNPEYVSKVADLVLENSKIDLVIQDCLTITETVVDFSYDEVTTTYTTREEDGKVVGLDGHENSSHHSYRESTSTSEKNTILSYIREVDTWIVNVKQKVHREKTGPSSNSTSTTLSDYQTGGEQTSGGGYKTTVQKNRTRTTTVTTTSVTYKQGVTSSSDTTTTGIPGVKDHLLFIGDSWGAGAKSLISSTFPGTENVSKGGSYAHDGSEEDSDWLSESMYDSVKGKNGMKGIYIELGINGPEWNEMGIPTLANKLREDYPDLPIYIQKCFNISSKMNNDEEKAKNHNAKIDKLNTILEQYCSSHDNVYFIDTTATMIEDGHLKDSLSNLSSGGDGFHLNAEGNKLWIENMKAALSGSATLADGATKGISQEIPADIRANMQGKSMVDNSDIGFDDLRYLTIPYINFSEQRAIGHMVVHKDVAEDVLSIFEELYKIKYPIEKMELIDKYYSKTRTDKSDQGSDYASIDANNTSAFNYRASTDSGGLSKHALGKAIDINPQINPYVKSDGTGSHPNASKYWDRSETNRESLSSPQKEAFITKNTEIYKIFTKHGWTWLGDTSYNDTQHFQKQ